MGQLKTAAAEIQYEIAEVEATPRRAHDRGDGIIEQFTEPAVELPPVAQGNLEKQLSNEADE